MSGPGTTLTARLDEQLALMRRWGQTDVMLVATALTPEHVAWAEANGVEPKQDPDARMGVLYLVNREGIRALR